MANDALEQSLRAEIDKHFNARLNQLRAEMDRIQDLLNDTVTRHKAETDTIMSKMMEKISVEDEAMNAVIAEHLRNAEAAAAEAAARAAAEAAAEQAAREAIERETAERAAREAAEREAVEQAAAREAAERLAQEQAAAKEAAERAAREATEQVAAEHAAREAAEQAAREAAERAAQEAAAREAAERAAQEAAERLAVEQAAAREAAEKLAAEQIAAREAAEKFAAQETAEKLAAQETAERLAAQEAAAREAAERAAREAAEAVAEASAVKQEAKKISAENISLLRNAIVDLSKQKSQAEILKTLVGYAGSLAPRVAFFVVKEGYTKGWRAFGLENTVGNDAITHIVLPLTDHTPLGEAVQNQSAWDGTPGQHQDDYKLIKGLGGLTPRRMVAIPLIARNRSVAVLYADSGSQDGDSINVDALDSLTHVAAINVEILAASRVTAARPQPVAAPQQPRQQYAPQTETVSEPAATTTTTTTAAPVEETAPTGPLVVPPAYSEPVSEPVAEEPPQQETVQSVYEEPVQQEAVPIVTAQPPQEERSFDLSDYQSAPTVETTPVAPVQTYVPVETPVVERQTFTPAPTQPTPTVTTPASSSYGAESRFRRRDIDLPIEVNEDERRFHNEARRFARLLVSEIKLYNEPKVKEGREYGDLYDRLREAIDRSREMYDKRVSPQVASKFDYFNYELVNTLAEGDESKLGGDYPGASV